MIAAPRDMPELTKPNTLPICPGGAASLTMTSRGVFLAPVIRPQTNSTTIVASSANETTSTSSSSAAAPMVKPTTKGRCRSVRSATHPPISTPPIWPTMYPVSAEAAAATGNPCTWCRIVISQDWMPAPAAAVTMKNAKNIRTDRLNSSLAPRDCSVARLCGRRAWSIRIRLCHRIAATTGRPKKPDEDQRAAPAKQQHQRGRRRWCGGEPYTPGEGVKGEGSAEPGRVDGTTQNGVIGGVEDRIADTREQGQDDELPIVGRKSHRENR